MKKGWEPRHKFFGTNCWNDIKVATYAEVLRRPLFESCAKFGSASCYWIARRVRCRNKSILNKLRSGIDRRALREIDKTFRMRSRYLSDRSERIPRKIWKFQSYSAFAGRAETFGWSLFVGPTLLAPPGEPISTKNSPAIGPNSFHCEGMSSS